MFFDQIGGVADDLGVENRLAFGVVKRRNRHAPGALAGDAPIGPGLDRALDPVDAPVRHPFDAVNLSERAVRNVSSEGRALRIPDFDLGLVNCLSEITWSISMNHWSMARKMMGVLLRQQCG